jgi:aspartyl protease family protein
MDVSNNPIAFIVDTGASVVTLSHQDAENLNLYLSDFDYNITVRTAAGLTTMAEINLDRVTIGVIELYNVKAFVAREGMLSVSLLGMNFLNRLDRFEFQDGQLVMEQ